jgi:hypothetical protein
VTEGPVRTFEGWKDIGYDRLDIEFAIQVWDWMIERIDPTFEPTPEERSSGLVTSPFGFKVRLSRPLLSDELWLTSWRPAWQAFRTRGTLEGHYGELDVLREIETAPILDAVGLPPD